MRNRRLLLAMMSFVCTPVLSARGQGASALKLVQKIPMPNVQDRLDHLGVDVPGKRLFIAALGLLYAPTTGKKMQKKVSDVTDKVIDKVDEFQQTVRKFANA